jgi:hypothetical protein
MCDKKRDIAYKITSIYHSNETHFTITCSACNPPSESEVIHFKFQVTFPNSVSIKLLRILKIFARLNSRYDRIRLAYTSQLFFALSHFVTPLFIPPHLPLEFLQLLFHRSHAFLCLDKHVPSRKNEYKRAPVDGKISRRHVE